MSFFIDSINEVSKDVCLKFSKIPETTITDIDIRHEVSSKGGGHGIVFVLHLQLSKKSTL